MSETREPILEVKNVKKTFGDKHIHQGISFEIYPQETLALFGGSGSGKSVILRSLIGLEKPDSGSIEFLGEDISKLPEKALFEVRKKIAYVFQNGALFDSLSVFDNLAYSLREHTSLRETEISQRIDEILKLVDLPGTENLLPSELSGGMQKRVGLARSIILRPEIILYDEPTAGLDPMNTLNILRVMKRLAKRGATSVFVTHDVPAALSVADRIAFLKDGKIHLILTPEQAKSSDDSFVRRFVNPHAAQAEKKTEGEAHG